MNPKQPHIIHAFIPVVVLVALLSYNVIFVFGDDALAGSNQMILLFSAAVAAILALFNGVRWDALMHRVGQNIAETTPSLIILLLIGSLAGTWMISGIVPAMIYYGLQLLDASYFLPATAVICAIVSLATGSSWSTVATVGIALLGIGRALEMNEAIVGGAIISGAYFGDKLSPLSDTTNLAPAMAGTDLFTHIRYMLYTTLPSMLIALIIYWILGWYQTSESTLANASEITSEIRSLFHITPFLFLVPVAVIAMIVKRVPAVPALFIGTLLGALFALIFQSDLLTTMAGSGSGAAAYELLMNAMTVDVSIPAAHPVLSDLLATGGMSGMLSTIWLILCAMIFGGVMEAAGFLQIIAQFIIRGVKSTFGLVSSTVGTCLVLNVTASDQYLAIVVPGKMYAPIYQKRSLKPEVLSRTLEDSGTVTSVLVPWNTCGATQAGILGVATWVYAPLAFFNWISPLMSLIFAGLNLRINRIENE